jgi:hypothetical protein
VTIAVIEKNGTSTRAMLGEFKIREGGDEQLPAQLIEVGRAILWKTQGFLQMSG